MFYTKMQVKVLLTSIENRYVSFLGHFFSMQPSVHKLLMDVILIDGSVSSKLHTHVHDVLQIQPSRNPDSRAHRRPHWYRHRLRRGWLTLRIYRSINTVNRTMLLLAISLLLLAYLCLSNEGRSTRVWRVWGCTTVTSRRRAASWRSWFTLILLNVVILGTSHAQKRPGWVTTKLAACTKCSLLETRSLHCRGR